MSLQDARWIFSDAQAITATADSTNTVDTGMADPNQGAGHKATVRVEVGVDFADGTSVSASLQDCATVGGTYTVIATGPVILVASLLVGKRMLEVQLPKNHLRHLKVVYTVVGTPSAGAVNAYLTLE